MGTIQRVCRHCGSTRVNGWCDCPSQEARIINLIECAYCGHHMTPERYSSHLQDCAHKASAMVQLPRLIQRRG